MPRMLNDGYLANEFSGIVVTTHTGCASPLLQQELQPDLVIIDDASNMTEATTNYIIAHFTPKAWVITGDHTQDHF
ncbi:hypothetical protein FVEN_g13105 [Fusarium venenatum]|nr:hypothetical protein FVEN_g13105 [Fusarium venenatum]